MKKDIALVIACVLVTVLCCWVATSKADVYTVRATIYKVSYEENMTLLLDERGQLWGWEGTEVPVAGTEVLMTMEGHNNEWLIDDEILSFKAL